MSKMETESTKDNEKLVKDFGAKRISKLKDFQIMPDVIGIIDDEKWVFIESKIVALGLREIGQLIAYCLIAKPEIAILCSTINSEAKLEQFKQETVMNFGTKKIQCAKWNNSVLGGKSGI